MSPATAARVPVFNRQFLKREARSSRMTGSSVYWNDAADNQAARRSTAARSSSTLKGFENITCTSIRS